MADVSPATALLARVVPAVCLSGAELELVRAELDDAKRLVASLLTDCKRAADAHAAAEEVSADQLAQLQKVAAERDHWRHAVCDLFNLDEKISDEEDVIKVSLHEGEWRAFHEEYPEEGYIPLERESESPAPVSAPQGSPPSAGGTGAGGSSSDEEEESHEELRADGQQVAGDEELRIARGEVPAGAPEHEEQNREAGAGRLAGDDAGEGGPPTNPATANDCHCGKFAIGGSRGFVLDFQGQKHSRKECPPDAKKLRWGHNGAGSLWHLWTGTVETTIVGTVATQKASCGEEVTGNLLYADRPITDAACVDCLTLAYVDVNLNPCEAIGLACQEPGSLDPDTGGYFCKKFHLSQNLSFRQESFFAAHPGVKSPKADAKKWERHVKKRTKKARKGAAADANR